jgi:hypothetical protein
MPWTNRFSKREQADAAATCHSSHLPRADGFVELSTILSRPSGFNRGRVQYLRRKLDLAAMEIFLRTEAGLPCPARLFLACFASCEAMRIPMQSCRVQLALPTRAPEASGGAAPCPRIAQSW